MIARTHPLWTRLHSFEFDTEDPALTFAQRLAREQRWTQDFALRVIEEYRRFLFLACTLKHPVTPSQEVDEAWHLHLTYTRSYWERLCPQVLQRSLHHDPTRGGTAEGEKFVDWYERTLNAYRDTFDQEPPSDIWPGSKARFAPIARSPESATNALHQAGLVPPRSNADYWVIRKPSRQRSLTTVACGLGTLLIGGCTPLVLGTNRSSMALVLALAAFAVTAVIILLVAAFHRNNGRQSSGCSTSSSGCSGFIDGSGGHHGHGSGHDGHGGHGGDAGSHGGGDGGAGCSGGSDGGGGGDGGGGCGGGGCGGGGD